jgi:hypothetical protein
MLHQAKRMGVVAPARDIVSESNPARDALRSLYLESLHLVERLHRRLLDVIKAAPTSTPFRRCCCSISERPS